MAMKYVRINYCANFGMLKEHELSKSNAFGGIIGSIMAQNDGGYARSSIIEDCINYDDITIIDGKKTWETYCGGIIGVASNNTCVNRCVNYGDITGFGYSGGIAGVMGCPSNVGRFLFWSWEILPASQNVLIANCINYGSIGRYNKSLDSTNARIYLGSIVGLTTGESLKANISVFEIAYGISINDCGSYSDAASDISGGATDIYTLSDAANLCKEGFLPDYEGSSVPGLTMIWGWESGGYTPELNSQYYGWICTTVLVDLGLVSPPCSSYEYVLAHTEMLTTLLIYPQYRKEGSTSQKFDIKDDSIEIYANWISSNGNVNKENIWDKGNAVRFYTPRGFSSTKFTPLQIRYSTKDYKASSVEDDSPMFTANWGYSDKTYNYIQFEASVEDRVSLYLIFNIQLKKLPVTVKLGEFIEAKTWFSIFRTNADYKFEKTIDSFDYSGGTYSSNWIAISEGESGYIPGENVNLNISPCYGYAVLCCFYFNSGEVDKYNSLSSLEDQKDFNCSEGVFEPIKDNYIKPSNIKPSNYGDDDLTFEFKRDYSLVIYLVPVKYNINVEFATVVGDDNGDKNITSDDNITGGLASYAFTGAAGTSNIEKSFSFKKSEFEFEKREVSNESDLFRISYNFFDYGFKYTLYASTYTDSKDTKIINTGTDFSEMEAITLYSPSDDTGQLNTKQELRFSMLNLVKTAVENSEGIKSNRIKIVVFRKAIDYTVEFVNMVDSFTAPGDFIDRTAQKIGGVSSLKKGEEIETFNVLDNNVNFSMEPKPGYKMVGSSFYERPNFTEDSEEDVATGSMLKFLNNYIIDICNYDVESQGLKNNTIKIFVYYKLQTYKIFYGAEDLDRVVNSSYEKCPSLSIESINASDEMEGKTSNGDGGYYKEVYYYAPVTLYTAKSFKKSNTKFYDFIGWWERPIVINAPERYDKTFKGGYRKIHFYEIKSLNTEYILLTNPNYVNDKSKTNTSDYEIYMVAAYESFVHDETPLKQISYNVFEVSSADDLHRLSTSVRLGNTYEGCVIKQTADIDMKDNAVYPIGTQENPFEGIYDGQYYQIENVDFGKSNGAYRHDVGLFGYTDGAVVKNLTMNIGEKYWEVLNTGLAAVSHAGVFIANAKDTSMINLKNCHINVEFHSYQYFDNEINYRNEVNFYSDDEYGYEDVYNLNDNIPELENAGYKNIRTLILPRKKEDPTIRDGKYLGGIVGKMEGGSLRYSSVEAEFWLNAAQREQCAGLVGFMSDGAIIEECYVWDTTNGTRRTEYDVLANYLEGDQSCSIINSYYRFERGTDYYNVKLENGNFENFKVEDKGGSSGSYSLNKDIYFQLPNGWWTLRVFYWT